MKRFLLLIPFILACSVATLPPLTRDEAVSPVVLTATATQLPKEQVGKVAADALNYRACPSVDCQILGQWSKDTPLMGYCLNMENGDKWLFVDGDKYAAVLVNGERYVSGVCQ